VGAAPRRVQGGIVTSVAPRALSVAELQAAVEAAWQGDFRPTGSTRGRTTTREPTGSADATVGSGGSSGRLVRDGGRSAGIQARGQLADSLGDAATCLPGLASGHRSVVVVAAHPGAGASSVALAVAVVVAESDMCTHLVDCAAPNLSGLVASSDTELGTDGSGWRKGRRGSVTIHRPGAKSVAGPPLLTRTSARPDAGLALVLDPAWPSAEPAVAASRIIDLPESTELIVVTRVSVPGLRATEGLLAHLPGRSPLIAAIGAGRWPGVVTASCGPYVRAARAAGRVVAAPLDPDLAVTGLSTDPLPRPLLAAARALARFASPWSVPTRSAADRTHLSTLAGRPNG
jgi:hypothetical protein